VAPIAKMPDRFFGGSYRKRFLPAFRTVGDKDPTVLSTLARPWTFVSVAMLWDEFRNHGQMIPVLALSSTSRQFLLAWNSMGVGVLELTALTTNSFF